MVEPAKPIFEPLTASPVLQECTACRVCGSSSLAPIVSLGDQFIAGAFFKEEEKGLFRNRYPLDLVRCVPAHDAKACGLVQLRHTLSRKLLFSNYGYRSAVNQTMRDNLREIAHKAEKMAALQPGDTVLDIGCNDGTLLKSYATEDPDRIGFDPAGDVTQYALGHGIQVEKFFFSAELYRLARPNRPARIVTSIAMLYDLENPLAFTREVASVLAPDGVWVIELSYVVRMLQTNSFDTICHEHLEYYALRQIEWMASHAGLVLHDVEFNDINGGSFRLFLRPESAGSVPVECAARIAAARAEESRISLDTEVPYEAFRAGATRVRSDVQRLIEEIHGRGEKVYVYGASTKGNVILQYCGIDATVIPAAADRNPDKWGSHMLGTGIPIISEEQGRSDRPDYFLVLPYHFVAEFRKREKKYLSSGGKFILPIPEVRVVGLEDE